MKTQIVTISNGRKHIHQKEYDGDDALDSIRSLLKSGKIEKAYMRVIGKPFGYRITYNEGQVQIRGTILRTL